MEKLGLEPRKTMSKIAVLPNYTIFPFNRVIYKFKYITGGVYLKLSEKGLEPLWLLAYKI
jgi:hypothetical protein